MPESSSDDDDLGNKAMFNPFTQILKDAQFS